MSICVNSDIKIDACLGAHTYIQHGARLLLDCCLVSIPVQCLTASVFDCLSVLLLQWFAALVCFPLQGFTASVFCCFRVLLLRCFAASVFCCFGVRLLNSALACSFSVTLSSAGLLSINTLHRDNGVPYLNRKQNKTKQNNNI